MLNSLLRCGKAQDGQAFTLEGIIAAVMVLTATYFLFHTSIIVSPLTGETSDAQLKQLGQDALRTLDNPGAKENDTLQNALAKLNSSNSPDGLLNSLDKILPANVDYNLTVLYYNTTKDNISSYSIVNKSYTMDTVSASRYIAIRNGEFVKDSPFRYNQSEGVEGSIDKERPIVLEVKLILWRI